MTDEEMFRCMNDVGVAVAKEGFESFESRLAGLNLSLRKEDDYWYRLSLNGECTFDSDDRELLIDCYNAIDDVIGRVMQVVSERENKKLDIAAQWRMRHEAR